jgi:hypothetical protein
MSKTIILFSGSAGSGKDTSYSIIKKYIENKNNSIILSHWSFGRALKEITVDLCSLFINQHYDVELMDNYGYKEEVRPDHTIYSTSNNPEPLVIRKLLQIIGTDILRKQLGDDIFAKTLLKKIENQFSMNNGEQIAFITDLRFENEQLFVKDYCKQNGYRCITIYIRRTVNLSDTHLHSSEKQYDRLEKDIIIENCGSLLDLELEINNIVSNLF